MASQRKAAASLKSQVKTLTGTGFGGSSIAGCGTYATHIRWLSTRNGNIIKSTSTSTSASRDVGRFGCISTELLFCSIAVSSMLILIISRQVTLLVLEAVLAHSVPFFSI